jgi:hypothetical protein
LIEEVPLLKILNSGWNSPENVLPPLLLCLFEIQSSAASAAQASRLLPHNELQPT